MIPELTDEQIAFLKRLRYGMEIKARRTIYDKDQVVWFERIGDTGFITTELGRCGTITDPWTGAILNHEELAYWLTSNEPQVSLKGNTL